MAGHWWKSPKKIAAALLLALPLIALACGSSATATPLPTNTTAPTATIAPTDVPTAMPQVTDVPTGGDVMTPKVAPAFADYWNPPTAVYGDPVRGGTLRINYEDPLDHANTWGAYSGVSSRYRIPTHNYLVEENPYNAGEVIPDLARGWTNHDDAQGITLFFHDNIMWHNGEPFVCEDARFTLETMVTGVGLTASEMAGKLSFIDVGATKCDDDLTLNVRFTGPSSTALAAFTDRAALMFNKAWFEAGGEDAMFQDVSVGTGPFTWDSGQSVGIDEQNFTANPDYFKEGLPYLDAVTVFGILDESKQQAVMLAHESDWHWVRNFGQYDAYVDHPQITTVIRATRGHHSLWLNKRNAPFDNIKVRQAIVMGMDREAAIRVLQETHGSLGFIMSPGSVWELTQAEGCAVPGWCPPEDGDWDARREEVKAMLAAEGFDFDKKYEYTVESDGQVGARATFFQEQLRLIGIDTTFDLVETVAYRSMTAQGTWGDIISRNDTMPADDPALGMGQYFRCAGTGNHWTPGLPCDENGERLLDLAASTVDPVARKAISDELQLYAMEQYWKFPLYWEQEAVAFWPEVRGYAHHPQPSGAFLRWEQLWIDPAHAGDSNNSGQTSGIPGGI